MASINNPVDPRHRIQTGSSLMNAVEPARASLAEPAQDLRPGYADQQQDTQRAALQDLQKRYADIRNPTPRDSSQNFWKWLADFGIGISDANIKGQQGGRNLSGLSLLGAGGANSAKGYFNNIKDAEKLKALQLGNLGGEMDLLTAMGKLGDAKEWSLAKKQANGYHDRDRVYTVPGSRIPKVIKFKPKAVYFQNPKTLETQTLDQSDTKEIAKAKEGGFKRTSLPPPVKAPNVRPLTAKDVGKGGEFQEWAAFRKLHTGNGDSVTIDTVSNKPTVIKASKKKEAWQPYNISPEEYKKKFGQDIPAGMVAMVDMNSAPGKENIKLQSTPTPSEKTFVDPKGIAEPISVDMRDPAAVADAKKKGMVNASLQLKDVPKGQVANWRKNVQDIKFGRSVNRRLRDIFNKKPGHGGIVGTIKEIIQEGGQAMKELSAINSHYSDSYKRDLMSNNIDEGIKKDISGWFKSKQKAKPGEQGFDKDLAIVNQLTASLRYAVALSNKTSGRLNRQDVEIAEEQVQTRGGITVAKALAQLENMDELMKERTRLTMQLLSGKVTPNMPWETKEDVMGKKPTVRLPAPEGYEGTVLKWVDGKLKRVAK